VPKTGESRRKIKNKNIMENTELFTQRNYKFFSIHKGVVGSLYFRGVDKMNNTIHRGRIRLVHNSGPKIENQEVDKWSLYTLDNNRKMLENSIIDMVDNDSLIKMSSQKIYEKYTNHSHHSRGYLEVCDASHQISDEQITELVSKIQQGMTNDELKKYAKKYLPEWLNQDKA
jgi:hypothetical protein